MAGGGWRAALVGGAAGLALLAGRPAAGGARADIATAAGPTVVFHLEVAADADSRQRGLMGRRSLPADAGMVFVFADALPRQFWMRDTPLSLDLACVGADGVITAIIAGAQPLCDAPLICRRPTQWVLEVGGGALARRGVAAGDRVRWRQVPGAAERRR